ncbi:MAG TPA: 4-alpha-glucanotransferase [Gammaproteobacteria bacterium]|nr:4-alpha-glucanotransferase [Gammaproteobacteria bacterium]
MAERGAAIERLRRLRGIGRSFFDFRGREHALSEDTLRDLLAALGHASGDEAVLQREADALEEREWLRVLAPVAVLRDGDSVPLTVFEPLLPVIRWRVETEQGDTLSGAAAPAELPVLGRRRIRELSYARVALALPPLPPGYHSLSLEKSDDTPLASSRLIVAPLRCYEPEVLRDGGRVWGTAIQLYTLRSARNWGIGDFTDLAGFAAAVAGLGADFVGLNPLHALFPADPASCAPYSPSSRFFLNIAYIDPEAVPEFADCVEARRLVATPEFQRRLAGLRDVPHVDYPGVLGCKLEVLRNLHRAFRAGGSKARRFEFQQYVKSHGDALEKYALFHAIHEHLSAAGETGGWPAWPAAWRDPGGAAARSFLAAEPEAVEFHGWLQWIATTQLNAAECAARDAGMRLGLYHDLAVGPHGGGAETWADRDLYADGATVGAPPDSLAPQGQDWAIPPWHPDALRACAYEPFVRLLRANMGRGGALRIDHVMMLFRLWWVPRGRPSAEGGYVHYRLDELMAIVALESHRQRCLVIGEDLGTVPSEVRAAMARHGLYSYRVLLFERDGEGRFRRPGDYPRRALATASTHDLPPLASFWTGSDIDLRERLGLYPEPGQAARERAGRAAARDALWDALAAEGLVEPDTAADGATVSPPPETLANAVQCFLARSASAVLALQPEDWLGVDTPVNVPGTHEAYLNWARKLPADWQQWVASTPVRALAEAVCTARQHPPPGSAESEKIDEV